MDFKILPFELKASEGDGSQFAGHANAFYNIDSAQEIVTPGAFADTLEQFLAVGFIGGLNHNWDEPIGRPTTAREDAKGLYVEGQISNTQHGKDCKILLKDKVVKKMSIGYRVLGDEYLENAEEVAAFWKQAGYTPTTNDIAKAQGGARLLTKLHLYEFSPVTVPANSMADITRVKQYSAQQITTERQFEKLLRDVGFSKEASKIICVSGYKALHRRDAEEEDTDTDAQDTPPESPEQPETTADISAGIETIPPLSIEETAVFVAPVDTEEVQPEAVAHVETVNQEEIRALYASLLHEQAAHYAPSR